MKKLFSLLLAATMTFSLTLPALADHYTYSEPEKSTMMPRSTPETHGMSSQYILDLLDAFDYADAEVHNILMAIDGEVVFEGHYAPYTALDPHIMFSGTKIFTNAAVGVAVTEGYLHLDDYVYDVLKDYVTQDVSELQSKVQLKHLLTMTSGVDRFMSGSELRPLTTSWIEHILTEPIVHEPGTYYLYSSGNTMLSSAMVTVATGKTCLELLNTTGFCEELGIKNFTWDMSPDGFNAGHGGIKITAEDLAKIASACYANETYMQAANTLTYTLPATNLHQNERTIKATNLMLDPEYAYHRDYVRGMKTGFTTLAGRCFVTFAQQDGHTYGLVVLGSDMNNIYRECAEILDWAFSSFSDRQLVDTETVLTTIPLTKCRTEKAVELYAASGLSGYGHADDEVTFEFSVPESTSATVKEGAVLGTATVYLDGYEMGTVDLVTHKEYVSDFRSDTKTTLLLMAALIGILIVLGFLTMVAGGGSLNLRRRSRSRRR